MTCQIITHCIKNKYKLQKNETCNHQYILLMIRHKILSNVKIIFDKEILLIEHKIMHDLTIQDTICICVWHLFIF